MVSRCKRRDLSTGYVLRVQAQQHLCHVTQKCLWIVFSRSSMHSHNNCVGSTIVTLCFHSVSPSHPDPTFLSAAFMPRSLACANSTASFGSPLAICCSSSQRDTHRRTSTHLQQQQQQPGHECICVLSSRPAIHVSGTSFICSSLPPWCCDKSTHRTAPLQNHTKQHFLWDQPTNWLNQSIN